MIVNQTKYLYNVKLIFHRSQRLSFGAVTYTTAGAAQYTPRQLDYIAQLFREMLSVRQLTLKNQNAPTWFQGHLNASSSQQQEDPVEDLIYLLSAILEQAKELALGDTAGSHITHGSKPRKRAGNRKNPRGTLNSKVDNGSKLKMCFDASVNQLLDSVRRDIETTNADLSDDAVLVRHVLKWLYRGLDEDKRHLAPVLRPYLNRIFAASHENGWHLEEWRRRHSDNFGSEIKVLGSYCKLLITSETNTTSAMLDAVNKGWMWAENMLDMAEYLVCSDVTGQPEVGLQLVLTPEVGKVVRRNIYLPIDEHQEPPGSRYSTLSSAKSTYSRNTLKSKKATLLRGTTVSLPTLLAQRPSYLISQGMGNGVSGCRSGNLPPHCRLRDTSPLTLLLDGRRRYGHQRGVGDTVQALITLHKFSVLQEISALLPEDERVQMLDAIQKLSKETRRAANARRAKQTTPNRTVKSVKKKSAETKLPQIYRPKADFNPCTSETIRQEDKDREKLALKQQETIAEREKQLTKEIDKIKADTTLLATCRAVRSQSSTLRNTTYLGGSSTFNGSFFLEQTTSLPLARETSLSAHFSNPNVALLQLTDDKQLMLSKPRSNLTSHVQVRADKAVPRKRDIVTKL
ncbi:hypothetical protein C0J52_03575 [Blattella germanica]|nr:hypothetical protein C0J52_03575 [Blattella germanica]